MEVRTRIAPSPTGDPHVGTAYIALFNQLFARRFSGKFLLRIEDTDQTRSKKEFEENIFQALRWTGLQWDEGPDVGGECGPYRQSERTTIYQQHCQKLLDSEWAYKCFATPEELDEMRHVARTTGQRIGYDRRYRNTSAEEVKKFEQEGRPYTVRLKVPLSGECSYEDGIKGIINVPWADVDDQVLLKSDGFPTYHLANVVDDHLMKISHVIRGDEWLASTPKHLLLYQAFGWTPPKFLHMPLLLGADGKKLSKRKNHTSIFFYRDCGYLPSAFLNFLSLMGYSQPNNEEIYTLEQCVASFDPKRIGASSGAFFDQKKLDWINQQYLIHFENTKNLWQAIHLWAFPESSMEKLMELAQTRIKTFGDFFQLCHFFFVNQIDIKQEDLQIREMPPKQAASILQVFLWIMEGSPWAASQVEQASHKVSIAFGLNHKKDIMPLLFTVITGKIKGPPLFTSIEILGMPRAHARFLDAIQVLGGISKKSTESLRTAWQEGKLSTLFKDSDK